MTPQELAGQSDVGFASTAAALNALIELLFFHKRLWRTARQKPLPSQARPSRQVEQQTGGRYYKADKAIENILDLLQAA